MVCCFFVLVGLVNLVEKVNSPGNKFVISIANHNALLSFLYSGKT